MSEYDGAATSKELTTRLAAALAWTDHLTVQTMLGQPIKRGEHPDTDRLQFFHNVAHVLVDATMNGGGYAAGVQQVADLVEKSSNESGQPWGAYHREMLEAILMAQAGPVQFIVDHAHPHRVGSDEEAQHLADLMRTPSGGSA